jgi:CRP-like cAMP-binding protein
VIEAVPGTGRLRAEILHTIWAVVAVFMLILSTGKLSFCNNLVTATTGQPMLETIDAFARLPPGSLARLRGASSVLEVRDHATIFRQGDPADAVFAIAAGDGRVRIGVDSAASKTLMVQVFHAGDIFGEVAVIDGNARTAEARAEGRLRLLRIPAGTFMAVLAEAPELGEALCSILATRLRRTFELLQDATFETLEVRLARQLLYLADAYGRHTAGGLRLGGRFRQSDLADLLGATPRSIITILNAWRAGGIVTYDAARGLLTLSNEAAMRGLVRHHGE